MTTIVSVATDATRVAAVDGPRARGVVVREAAGYFAASLAALALDAALLWFGTQRLGLASWSAGAVAYGAGLVLVYVLSIHLVFATRAVRDTKREFLVFALLGVIGLVLNSATLFVATGLGIALPIAKALSAGIGFVANFVSRKVLLFTRVDAPGA